MTDSLDRRRFLKVLGVTGAGAAALSSCGIGPEPTERLIPYLIQPEDQIPGTATYYADNPPGDKPPDYPCTGCPSQKGG